MSSTPQAVRRKFPSAPMSCSGLSHSGSWRLRVTSAWASRSVSSAQRTFAAVASISARATARRCSGSAVSVTWRRSTWADEVSSAPASMPA